MKYKQTNYSVAVILVNPANEEEFLVVRRPSDDKDLPNVWGLPAVTLKQGELPESGARRVGEEKLCTQIEPVYFIGAKCTNGKDYRFILMDIKAKLIGETPSVYNSETKGTKYVDQKWVSDLSILKDAAQKGSLCSQIFLEFSNFRY